MAGLTQEIVRELLDYNPETGILTWKQRGRHWFTKDQYWKRWNTRYAGKQAAKSINRRPGDGYSIRKLQVLWKNYTAHKIIWLWMTGEFPKDQVDHIDRDGTNNKWSNLREADSFGNAKNRSKLRSNTSGVTGVNWHSSSNRWHARVSVDGFRHTLGFFAEDDLASAAKAVEDFRLNHGFAEDHGKEYAHFITVAMFVWTFSTKSAGHYDIYGAFVFTVSLAISMTAWVVWGIMKVFGG